MARATLQRRLVETEQKIALGQRQIAGQRETIAELERKGRPTDHAKYLLAALELLQAAHRDGRKRLLKELGNKSNFCA
jgi:hypothetical protein